MRFLLTPILALIGAMVALFVSSKTWSRRFLQDELTRNGIDYRRLPELCLQELADQAMADAELMARVDGQTVSTDAKLQSLEHQAGVVCSILQGSTVDPVFERTAGTLRRYRAIN